MWYLSYEIYSYGFEKIALEFFVLSDNAFTENLRKRHDFPTLLLPISSAFRLYLICTMKIINLPF